MIKKMISALALSAAVFAVYGAQAADLPARPMYTKAAPAIEMYNWTGFYIGANLGGSFGHEDIGPVGLSTDMNGVVGGGQIGYNWQGPNSPWVFGVEFDGQGTSQKGSVVGVGGTLNEELPWFVTGRGRIGYAFTPMMMLYGTGGFAVVDHRFSAPGFSQDDTKLGWTAGVGIEGMITRQWSWKVEYLHLDVPSFTPANAAPVTVRLTDEIVRGGINFHF
jgi:outer membrane immunogenic protein